jgi:hypothetical protein
MADSATFDPGAVVTDGLAVLVGLSGDPSLAVGGTSFYQALAEALPPEIRSGDRATIALPCVRMADTLPALLEDRAILAWKAGRFRKTSRVETVPLSSSWGATIAPGIGAHKPVKVLTVQWGDRPPWTLAVPSDDGTTRVLRTCFKAAPGAG